MARRSCWHADAALENSPHWYEAGGRTAELTSKQAGRLERFLDKGAPAHGFPGDYRTLEQIAVVIWQRFSIRYSLSGVRNVLPRMGWSSQKQQRMTVKRNDDAVRCWREKVWPRLKKHSKRRATFVFLDESGFCLVSSLRRSWSKRGRTPLVRTQITHHARINVIGALIVSPGGRHIRLCTQSHRRSLTGKQIIAFLNQLLARIRGEIVMLWDNAPIHTRRSVREFVDLHNRLQTEGFPTYAPELNPAEFIWTAAAQYLAGLAAIDLDELAFLLYRVLQRTRANQSRMWACIAGTPLRWRRWQHVR